MRHFAQLSVPGLGLGLFFLTSAMPSFATVVGTLSVAPAPLTAVSPSYLAVGAATYVVAPLTIVRPEITPSTVVSAAPLTFPGGPTLGIALNSFAPSQLSAAPLVVSPIVLTAAFPLPSSVASTITPTYSTAVSDLVGNFNAANTVASSEVLSLPTYVTPYAPFVSTVPEPRSISLVVLAGLLMGLVVKRRKSEALKNQA